MRVLNILAALAATLMLGSGATAGEKPEQPRQMRICRIVEVSGRVTPQRICRKVEPKVERETREAARDAAEPNARSDSVEQRGFGGQEGRGSEQGRLQI